MTRLPDSRAWPASDRFGGGDCTQLAAKLFDDRQQMQSPPLEPHFGALGAVWAGEGALAGDTPAGYAYSLPQWLAFEHPGIAHPPPPPRLAGYFRAVGGMGVRWVLPSTERPHRRGLGVPY